MAIEVQPGTGPRNETSATPVREPSVAPGLTRRSLLRRAGIAAETLAVAAVGGLGYRAYEEGVFSTGQGAAYDPWRTWDQGRGPMALVAAAILAPSPHNAQAWAFRASRARIELFADPSRSIGAVDPLGRELYVGLGAALENIMLAAPANGYRPRLSILPAPGQPLHAATIDLVPGPVRRSTLYAQIPHRHTDRSPYLEESIPRASLHAMTALASDLAGTRVFWFTADAERRRVGELMVAAAQALTDDREQSVSDNAWFRHDWDAIQRYRDGLTLDGQGLPELTTALAKLLPATSRSYNDAFWVTATRDTQSRTAAAYGVIAVADPHDNAQRLSGGRLLQRIHLWTAAHGLSLGHMNQITERADRERQLGLDPRFTRASADLLTGTGLQQLVAFRVGRPGGTDGRRLSPRRGLGEVLQ